MSGQDARQDVLGRKADAAQRAFEARGMSPSKALRRALSRTADVLWDLALVVHGVSVDLLDQDGVTASLGEDDLLVLLDGPDGATGFAALDRQVLTGLVEVQTIQQVTSMPVDERALTATDAAMVAPMLDGTMARFAENLDEHPLRAELEGFRFGAMVEDRRMVALILDAAQYRAFRADLDLALGRRRGTLSLILPERRATRAGAAGQPGAPGPHEALFKAVPVRLETVLARVSMPLRAASRLRPGDVLPLTQDCIDRAELRTGSGQLVARGRFGQLMGMRAVRINWPCTAAPAMAADAANAAETPAPDTPPPPEPTPEAPQAALPDLVPDPPADDAIPEGEDFPDLPPLDFETEMAEFDGLADFETVEES